jgi:hypothetical protein
MPHRWIVLPVAAACLAGCASSTGSTPQGTTTTTPRRDTNVITAEELATVAQGDLFLAVQQLRPTFLQTRGMTSTGVGTAPEVLQVYVNGIRTGDVNALHQIQVIDVKEVRRLSATEATQRFGTGHTMGAILVTRK